ncbi:MAG: hypothetical protein V7L04_18925 [Nostoc sp.]|uniref:hypothetical protein n=1 Tax=Nostoc sp. TaxID=1180 RepID=UPI002FF82795
MTKTLVAAATPIVDIANPPNSNYYVYFLISENAIASFYQTRSLNFASPNL